MREVLEIRNELLEVEHELELVTPYKDDYPEHYDRVSQDYDRLREELAKVEASFAEPAQPPWCAEGEPDDHDFGEDEANEYETADPPAKNEVSGGGGTLVLVEPPEAPRPVPPTDPSGPSEIAVDADLNAAVLAENTKKMGLPKHYVKALLDAPAGERMLTVYPAAVQSRADDPIQAVLDVLKAIALDFVHDDEKSIFHLLEQKVYDDYFSIEWEDADHPWQKRDAPGPNTKKASEMWNRACPKIRPQRRANGERPSAGGTIVSTADWKKKRQEWATHFAGLVEELGELSRTTKTEQQLNKWAHASLKEMVVAAADDGVELMPDNGLRCCFRPETKREAGKYSVHQMGLAIDFDLAPGKTSVSGYKGVRYSGINTKMTSLLSGYYSPVAKWICVYGEGYGWYPLWPEPWHWEYNPDDLAAKMLEGAPV